MENEVQAHARVVALEEAMRQEFPTFRIVYKPASALMRWIDWALKVITFGQARAFMSSFVTTIGTTVYVPADWDSWGLGQKYVLLRHERVHMRQAAKYGFLLFAFMYLFLPLPGGYARWRTRLEMAAYEETFRAHKEWYGDVGHLRAPEIRQFYVEVFTGPSYFWMWPFPADVVAWYDTAVDAADAASGE